MTSALWPHTAKTLAVSACISCLLAGWPAGALAQSSPLRPSEPVTLNFANADIEAVARTLAAITGRNVVVDPRVKGTINLVTDTPVPTAVAWTQFQAALRMLGFAMVEAGGLYKIVPEAEAKLQTGSVQVTAASRSAPGGQIQTQIFRLQHESASQLVPVLRPLITPNNTINVNAGSNALIITDYADNLQRLAKIIAALDVSQASDVEIIPLQHAVATELAPLVTRLVETGSSTAPATQPGVAASADSSFRTTILPEPRSNALILRAANPARVAQVRALVEKLDRPAQAAGSTSPGGNIHVVYLRNADAAQLATTLRAAMAASEGNGAGSASAAQTTPAGMSRAGTSSPSGGLTTGTSSALSSDGSLGGGGQLTGSTPSTGGIIQADVATNSLIITAPEPVYRQLRAVIDQLDSRRAQVLVESLIVEVNAEKAAEFGIQWQTALGKKGDSNIGLLGTNFSKGSGAGANLLELATSTLGTVIPAGGMNFGLGHNFGGKYGLALLARFLESKGDGNVLSTPNLLTLDNEEARIIIGQNVPFVTGQYTNNNTSNGSVNPFQTVERKDVGLSLRVRPQINENGTVKLTVFQEVSDVIASTQNNANGPTTSKRSIESTVLVEDGSIVVLGGLLQDRYSGGQEKVPGFGDVPLFGSLFKSESRRREKTELMVFLRPVIVRDNATSNALTWDRYDLMRGLQQQTQPDANVMLRAVPDAPSLPEMPMPTPAGGATDGAAPPTVQVPLPLRSVAPAPAPKKTVPPPISTAQDGFEYLN